jgi:hypothetical protein
MPKAERRKTENGWCISANTLRKKLGADKVSDHPICLRGQLFRETPYAKGLRRHSSKSRYTSF